MRLPNYIQEVIEREQADEAEPWLMYCRLIDGIEVKELSLYHIHLLDGLDNTILSGGNVDEANIAQFLWIISKDFKLSDNKARDKFIKSIADKNTYKLRIEINDYIKSGLSQSRAMANDEKEQKANAHFLAYVVHTLSSAYSWSIEYILNLPVNIVHQLVAVMNENTSKINGETYSIIRESDKLVNRHLREKK
jgi:hypothetical protein